MDFGSICPFVCVCWFSEWPRLFGRACLLMRDPFLIKSPLPNPPSCLKPNPHLSSNIRRCTGFLSNLSFSPLHPHHSNLFINEYTALDTKNLTSNELGNPFSHFWLPSPNLCVCFSLCVSEEANRSVTHRRRVAFVRLPSGP